MYMSPDAVASVQQCLAQHPGRRAMFFGTANVLNGLSVQAIQKKMERYAKPQASSRVVIVYGTPLRPTSWNMAPRSSRSGTSWGIARSPSASGTPKSRVRRSNRNIAHDAENFEARTGLRDRIIPMKQLYTTISIFVVKYIYSPLDGGTTDARQAPPPSGWSARPHTVVRGHRHEVGVPVSRRSLSMCGSRSLGSPARSLSRSAGGRPASRPIAA